MKRIILVALLLLVSVSAAVVRTAEPRQPNPPQRPAVERWEYLALAGPTTTSFSDSGASNLQRHSSGFAREGFVLEQHLDELGSKGWELVSVAGVPTDPVYYFKRRK